MRTLNRVINPSRNTNPFNHDTSYIKLYNSVKDDVGGGKDEYGQLINPRYLDDVFNFVTSLPFFTRKVRVQLDKAIFLHMKEVQVFAYNGTNVALGKTATQSVDKNGVNGGSPASNAVDGNNATWSWTKPSSGCKYHLSFCKFPKYHAVYHFNHIILTSLSSVSI